MKRGVIIAAALSLVATGAIAKDKKINGLELQQIQSRDFEAAKDVTFPAVMSVLQDDGYRIQSAQRDTGLITGIASTSGHTTWMPFVGFGRKKLTPVVSAYIEDNGKVGSRIRLNFVMTKLQSNGFGSTNDEQPITDAAVYREAFEKIQKAVFVRQATNAPSAANEPAAKPLSPTETPSVAAAGKVEKVSDVKPPK